MQYELVKRIIDVVGSIALLVIFSPVMIVVSILVKLTSPGPIIIESTNVHSIRTGKNGKKNILKDP